MRATSLGIDTQGTSPAQLLKCIGHALVEADKIPEHLVSLRLVGGGRGEKEGKVVRCWKCGNDVLVDANTVVDFQVDSAVSVNIH